MPDFTIKVNEEKRQMILLALAELALSRPGWDESLREIATDFVGLEMFDNFKRFNADRTWEQRQTDWHWDV